MTFVLYILLLVIFILVIEVISMIFRVTGLSMEKARFQVISLFTHTGFTTREAELISQHPLRRKIASYLMLVSYVTQAGLISLFTKLLIEKESISYLVIVIFVIILVFVIIGKNRLFFSKLGKILERYLFRRIKRHNKKRTIDEVLKLNADFGVYEIVLSEKNVHCGKSLRDARLKDHYIQILNIDRGSHIIEFPDADLILEPADKIVVYGRINSITEFMSEQK